LFDIPVNIAYLYAKITLSITNYNTKIIITSLACPRLEYILLAYPVRIYALAYLRITIMMISALLPFVDF
jgi:hypothetical protein